MAHIIEFNSKSELYSEFSNFHVAPFVIDGQTYPTVEHYFQSEKFPNDSVLQEAIRMAPTPAKAKKLGKTRSIYFRNDWANFRNEVMLKGVRAKFEQNAELMDMLRSTEGCELREKAFWDGYWGTGRSGNGKNKMGKILELIRTQQNNRFRILSEDEES